MRSSDSKAVTERAVPRVRLRAQSRAGSRPPALCTEVGAVQNRGRGEVSSAALHVRRHRSMSPFSETGEGKVVGTSELNSALRLSLGHASEDHS